MVTVFWATFRAMSKAEILAELPKLTPGELSEIQSRIEDLAIYGPDGWRADSGLTEAEKQLIEARLDGLERHPEKSIAWAEAEARLNARFSKWPGNWRCASRPTLAMADMRAVQPICVMPTVQTPRLGGLGSWC
jgi:hypothetical protein